LDDAVARDVEGRVALVTGANKGIGLAVAARLARLGHAVYLGSRDARRGADAAAALRADGIEVTPIELDVTDDATVRSAVATIDRADGRLDVLVNNAAVKFELAPSPPSECSLDLVRETFETNVFGAIRLTLAMLPLLRRSLSPRIVNVSSGLGSLALAADPSSRYSTIPLLTYNPSKAALNSVTLQFANELRDTAFKVNAADPGYTNTDMTRADARGGGARTADEAAQVIIDLATLPADGPTGCFFDERGALPW
jgi:NAD(P)-dependent dehydrogenase (short-subunit alcohol dehydrogenase family)